MGPFGPLEIICLATGFTGALTLVFIARAFARWRRPGCSVSVFCSPKGGCTDALVGQIKSAKKEVLMQVSAFSSKTIAQALVDAKTRGLNVDILVQGGESKTHAEMMGLLGEGLTPQFDAEHPGDEHVVVIDGTTVLTGSFSYTHIAEVEEACSLLLIQGAPDVARRYRDWFLEHKSHSELARRKVTAPPAEKAEKKEAA